MQIITLHLGLTPPVAIMISRQAVMVSSDTNTPHTMLRWIGYLTVPTSKDRHYARFLFRFASALRLIRSAGHHHAHVLFIIFVALAFTMSHGGQRQRGRSRQGGVVERFTRAIVAPSVEAY
jgi:hypothetical protein